jgi:hypothetical protein
MPSAADVVRSIVDEANVVIGSLARNHS